MLASEAVIPGAGQLIAQKYRLSRQLAKGGMGAVWIARHEELGIDVAIKFHLPGQSPSAVERLRREAKAAAALKSPHVVHVYDLGFSDETPYLVMELLEGEDLGLLLERTPKLPLSVALDYVKQAAFGLLAVHEAGFVHRDLKPSNLFITRQAGRNLVKVLDFGIVKTLDERSAETTEEGVILGSAAFMSPEQARGGNVGPKSDLWSLAAVFYRMLTGKNPFIGAAGGDLLVRVCTDAVPPPSAIEPSLPPLVDLFFTRAFARVDDARFASVEELLAALEPLEAIAPRPSLASLKEPSRPTGREDATLEHQVAKRRRFSPSWLLVPAILIGTALIAFGFYGLRSRDGHPDANALKEVAPSSLLNNERSTDASPREEAVPSAPLAKSAMEEAPPARKVERAKSSKKQLTPSEKPAGSTDPVFGLPLPKSN